MPSTNLFDPDMIQENFLQPEKVEYNAQFEHGNSNKKDVTLSWKRWYTPGLYQGSTHHPLFMNSSALYFWRSDRKWSVKKGIIVPVMVYSVNISSHKMKKNFKLKRQQTERHQHTQKRWILSSLGWHNRRRQLNAELQLMTIRSHTNCTCWVNCMSLPPGVRWLGLHRISQWLGDG